MTYARAKQQYDEAHGSGAQTRTDFRCAANGCPNTGCIDDEGESRRGTCYWHWKEPDRRNWDAITRRIRSNFAEMRNHNQPMPELEHPTEHLFEGETT